MAITATAQSALQDLSWDETIVPSLRKRLESESRAISKRLSTVSIGSGENEASYYNQRTQPRTSATSNRSGGRAATPSSMSTERPSAIPRPSLNYSRPPAKLSEAPVTQASSNNDAMKPIQKRSRTFSQPYVVDAALASAANGRNGYVSPSATRTTNALPTPASSRSNSPSFSPPPAVEAMNDINPKVSSNNRAYQPGQYRPNYSGPMQRRDEYDNREQWDGDEETYDASCSSINVDIPRVKQNGIIHEAPPFSANSSFASDAESEVRPSLEERPFEHWYRGDLSRNGGVGELRVGSRMEMLEIANYGHKLRQVRYDTMSRQRRRAESIGHRESVLFDDEPESPAPLVLDETPLTDMDEADTEIDTDREPTPTRSKRGSLDLSKHISRSATQPKSAAVPPSTPKHRQPSQIPRATPTAMRTAQRTASEPLYSLSASTSSIPEYRSRSSTNVNKGRMPNSQSQITTPAAQKRGRIKSPAITPANKKTRPAQQKRSKSTAADDRLSPKEVSEYPEVPDGPDSMADAIPSWTQPKKAGNWDDVVLPVVARKMGLDDQYEEADGSPKALRSPSREVIPPQPGTFGIDPNKRRQRYDPATGEEIPMEEFENTEEEMSQTPTMPVSNEAWQPRRFSKMSDSHARLANEAKQPAKPYSPPISPAPFAHYTGMSAVKPDELEVQEAEEGHSGCCKCIIM